MAEDNYESIISWIERRISSDYQTVLDGYDLYDRDSLDDFWQEFVRQEDKDGRLQHFFYGNPHYTKERPNFKWGGIEGTEIDDRLYDRIGRPLVQDFNEEVAQSISGQIDEAETADDIGEIDIPDRLLPEVAERLENTKNEKFIRATIEDPATEVSKLNQLLRSINRLPDGGIRRELRREIKNETGRLADLNQFLLEQVRSQSNEAGLDSVIGRILDSDLRQKQKDALLRVADTRRSTGFPETFEG